MKRKLITLLVLLSFGIAGQAQNVTNSAIENYIDQYKGLAMSEQIRTGVPAAITLAQGIFETGGGTSELCLNAHNHFGVKCKGQWDGETYSYDDDHKDECFRKYQNDRQSFMDHSNFLKNNQRYSRLFKIDTKRYRKWAEGLHECGYATNKQYASKLIGYIEQYNLEQYTVQALDDARFVASHGNEEDSRATGLLTADNGLSGMAQVVEHKAESTERDSEEAVNVQPAEKNVVSQQGTWQYQPVDWDTVQFYVTTYKNGLKGFYAPKGDLLLEYAIKHYIRYGKLLNMNDLPDEPLEANMFIYLEKKRKKGLEKVFQVQPGMDLVQVSQATAVDLEQLRLLNHLQPGENPAGGVFLQLQEMAHVKPALALAGQNSPDETVALKTRAKSSAAGNADDYVVFRPEDHQAGKTGEQPDTIETSEEAGQRAPKDAVVEDTEEEAVVAPAFVPAETQEPSATDTVAPTQESHLSSLEKLRAKMNGIVYGEKQPGEAPVQKAEKVYENEPGFATKQKAMVKNTYVEEAATPTDKLRAYMKSVKESQPQDQDYTTLPSGQIQRNAPVATVAVQNSTSVQYYTVKRGDTAYSIAKKFEISLTQLKSWNRLPKSMVVQAGEKLKVAP